MQTSASAYIFNHQIISAVAQCEYEMHTRHAGRKLSRHPAIHDAMRAAAGGPTTAGLSGPERAEEALKEARRVALLYWVLLDLLCAAFAGQVRQSGSGIRMPCALRQVSCRACQRDCRTAGQQEPAASRLRQVSLQRHAHTPSAGMCTTDNRSRPANLLGRRALLHDSSAWCASPAGCSGGLVSRCMQPGASG